MWTSINDVVSRWEGGGKYLKIYRIFFKPHLLKKTTGEVRCEDQTIGDFVATSFMDGPMQANLLHIELLSDR